MKTKTTIPPYLTEIYALAVKTFGTESKAEKWLNNFHPVLNNTPIDAAGTASGVIEVKKILGAISYGGVV